MDNFGGAMGSFSFGPATPGAQGQGHRRHAEKPEYVAEVGVNMSRVVISL